MSIELRYAIVAIILVWVLAWAWRSKKPLITIEFRTSEPETCKKADLDGEKKQ
jgi:hypothetical protein